MISTTYIESLGSVKVRIKHYKQKRNQKSTQETLPIASFNIQKKQTTTTWGAQIAQQHDIVFILGFPATKHYIGSMNDFATQGTLKFYSSPTGPRSHNMTGTFINSKKIQILGTNELGLMREFRKYYTDVRIRLKNGEYILLVNFYLPSDKKALQADIIGDAIFCLHTLKEQHRSLTVIYGGDLNHSMENTPSVERASLVAIKDSNSNSKTVDISNYGSSIKSLPTNNAKTCR
ncbi:hypothetical protein JCM33374_g5113 [Metschnikowia sp. JCM 33374]|nr:hypothetical protein JCM33374_g5113 [Metschnikowia sp. JCM 33374]